VARLVLGICLLAASASSTQCGASSGGAGDPRDASASMSPPPGDDASTDAGEEPPPDTTSDATPNTELPDASSTPEAGAAPASGRVLCHGDWPQPAWLMVDDMSQATDGAGNTYVALRFGNNEPDYVDAGTLHLNLGAPSNEVPPLGFAIAKFDDACNLVWVREFGPVGPANSLGASAIATDSASNVTVLGDFYGNVDFGTGTKSTGGRDVDNGFLLRLDSTGKTVFARQFVEPGATSPVEEYGLAVTPSGVSTIALYADSAVDFGSGPDSASGGAYDLVQFDGSGNVVFRKAGQQISPSIGSFTGVTTNASGFLWLTANAYDIFAFDPPHPILVGITSSGAYAWKSDDPGTLAGAPGGVDQLVLHDATPQSETLAGIGPDGSTAWSVTTPVSTYEGISQIAVDAHGAPVVVGSFNEAVTFGSRAPLTPVGGYDLAYQVFDTTGHLVSAGSWGGPLSESPAGVGVDPSGNILIAGTTWDPALSYTSSIFFVKLAPE
jgi:hypothetical protein